MQEQQQGQEQRWQQQQQGEWVAAGEESVLVLLELLQQVVAGTQLSPGGAVRDSTRLKL